MPNKIQAENLSALFIAGMLYIGKRRIFSAQKSAEKNRRA
jgi:hypothetical protein